MSEPKFTRLTNLSDRRLGASISFATDDWFAPAEMMLSELEPEWREGVFSSCGKWMDGWETRRKRTPGHDSCIIRLGLRGEVRGVLIDTCHFSGNYAPRASVQVCDVAPGSKGAKLLERLAALRKRMAGKKRPAGAGPGEEMMGKAASSEMFELVAQLEREVTWRTVVERTALRTGAPSTRKHFVAVTDTGAMATHVRLNTFPDGGVARLRIYGEVHRDWTGVSASSIVDLAAATNGGTALAWSDAHYGVPANLIGPGRAPNMGDGWETARNKDRPAILEIGADGAMILPGSDWAVIKLGTPGLVRHVEIDTNHFKGNFPESCIVEGAFGDDALFEDGGSTVKWTPLVSRVKLSAHRQQTFPVDARAASQPVSHVRLTMFPDGGVSRLRVFGVRLAAATKAKL